MNVATRPCIAATSLTALFRRKARSAAVRAGACWRLISNCEFMNSWLAANVPRPTPAASCAGVGLGTHGVDHAQVVHVAPDAARRLRVALAQEELKLGPDYRRVTQLLEAGDGASHGSPRVGGRRVLAYGMQVGDAARHAFFPRH